jgi:hypothetical protein
MAIVATIRQIKGPAATMIASLALVPTRCDRGTMDTHPPTPTLSVRRTMAKLRFGICRPKGRTTKTTTRHPQASVAPACPHSWISVMIREPIIQQAKPGKGVVAEWKAAR